jgi:DNA-binding transcriptional ArsR family regulator
MLRKASTEYRDLTTPRMLDASNAQVYIYTGMYIDTFEALADRTRRRIVESLKSGEKPVGEIVKHSGIHQSGVSRHLRILNEAGFVSMRPLGQQRLYSLRPEPFRELEAWLAGYRSLWERRLDRFAEALEQRKSSRGPHRRSRT